MFAGVVIPAHNESGVIARLLQALTPSSEAELFNIVVVCNGCSDNTADIARSFENVRVLEIATPSKIEAMRLGDHSLESGPRVFVDADVIIDANSVAALVGHLIKGSILATAPSRVIPRMEAPWAVACYYDVWERLPQVESGLFGRGAIAISEEGMDRVRALPPVMSDDLVASEAFLPSERLVVPEATVVVYPPRTSRDLVRRRTRVAVGNHEADIVGLRRGESRTSVAALASLTAESPAMFVRMPVFLAFTVVSRLAARQAIKKSDFKTWRTDRSSRL